MKRYKIIANKTQLKSVGIDEELVGVYVTLVRKFPTGFSEIETPPNKDVIALLGDRAQNIKYDIPNSWLSVIDDKQYSVLTPSGEVISVEEYMKSEDYNQRLDKTIDDFMTNKKEQELINLFKNM